jgi:hypothetical protein
MSKITRAPRAGKNSSDQDVNLAALEAAMKRDRLFFKRHPSLREYTREIMPGEFPRSEMPPNCEAHGRVIVRQIAPRVRIRRIEPEYFVVITERHR